MDFELMKKLSEADGVSSDEGEVAGIMAASMKKAGLKTEIDDVGNLIAYKSLGKKPLVVGAHMDEIGLMVKHIDEKGFVRFIIIGGIDKRTLINQQVTVRTQKGLIPGVIGFKPIHLLREEETKTAIDAKSLFIDVGAKDCKEAETMGVEIGNTITFNAPFRRMGKKMLTGKALDDRVGCYAICKLAEDLPPNVVLMGTTQEEVSLFGKGAAMANYRLEPRAFITADTTIAGDHPEVKPEEAPIFLGKGPALCLVEWGARGNVANKKLVRSFVDSAREEKIGLQIEVIDGGASDAMSVNTVRGGIPSIAVNVPVRYIHSAMGVAHEDDVDDTVRLLKRIIREL